MKKMIVCFLCGLLVGLSPLAMRYFSVSNPTSIESSLAQIVYKKLNKYQDEIDFDKVLLLAKEYSKGKHELKDETELYAPLVDLAEKKAERERVLGLQRVEDYLKDLAKRPEIKEIVPGKVFVEILKEGSGEVVSAKDPVSVHFKEYGMDGALIKDTLQKAYAIPLSQTIKGFQLGLDGAKVGETRKLYIHPDYGFGRLGRKGVNRLLIYEVAIVEKKKSLE